MKKTIMLWSLCALAILASCSGKNKKADAEEETTAETSAEAEAAEEEEGEIPIFVIATSDNELMVHYWTWVKRDADNKDADYLKSWARQDRYRKNVQAYTNLMIEDGGTAKVKLKQERLTNPDGDTIFPGILHYKPGIPNTGALLEPTDKRTQVTWGQNGVVVTDEYLKGHKRVTLKEKCDPWAAEKALPADVLKKLEAKYGMKVSESAQLCKFGDKYTYGKAQFKGEWKAAPKDPDWPDRKSCLAVDVLSDGENVYVNEVKGYYDSPTDFGWNVDDGGEYAGKGLAAVFEGENGLTLCYYQTACESFTAGLMTIKDGKLKDTVTQDYRSMVDESEVIWKSDMAKMRKIYLDADPEKHRFINFKEWADIYIDYDSRWRWIVVYDEENGHEGAIFQLRDGKFTLITDIGPNREPTLSVNGSGYLKLTGPEGGSNWYTEIYGFKDGKIAEHIRYITSDGETIYFERNNTEMLVEEGLELLNRLPAFEDEFNPMLNNIEEKTY